MAEENTNLDNLSPEKDLPEAPETPAPAEAPAPPRPTYTTKQRVLALIGAIFVIVVTLMYTYSLATGDLFFR